MSMANRCRKKRREKCVDNEYVGKIRSQCMTVFHLDSYSVSSCAKIKRDNVGFQWATICHTSLTLICTKPRL